MTANDPGILAGRIALISGASRGIGRAVAKCFAAEGAQLVLLSRTVGALEELDDEIRASGGLKPLLVPFDLRHFDGIDHLGASLHERYGRLDVLVGNAGQLGTLSPVGHITPESWDEVMDVNVTANYRLIRSLDPLLRQSDAGRAVFVTSGAASGTKAFWGAYAVSKAALDALVRSYAAEVAKTSVRVNLFSPGPLRTAMRRKAFPGENPDSLRPPDAVTGQFLELASPACTLNGALIEASNS